MKYVLHVLHVLHVLVGVIFVISYDPLLSDMYVPTYWTSNLIHTYYTRCYLTS